MPSSNIISPVVATAARRSLGGADGNRVRAVHNAPGHAHHDVAVSHPVLPACGDADAEEEGYRDQEPDQAPHGRHDAPERVLRGVPRLGSPRAPVLPRRCDSRPSGGLGGVPGRTRNYGPWLEKSA